MAVEFGDHNSGFHHTEVIRFINKEVLMNGGGPEFYMTFRSRSWNEIEDHLHTILVDPKVPRSLKRACTWSALALSVRVGARQREQQARRVGRLQEQVGERETASWTLASELQRLREERDQAAAQLVSTQTALQEAMDEREILRGRLLQAERSALPDVPEPKMQQGSASVWSLEEEEQEEWRSRQAQNMPNLEAQMPAPPVSSYLPGLPGPWVQSVQPFLRMPVPHPLPLNTQIPLAFPYSPPVPWPLLMESGATTADMATVVPQIAPAAIYPPGMWVSMGSREATASACGQTFHRHNEYPENLQDVSHMRNSVSHSEEGSKKPQGTPPHGDSSNNNHKESHVTSQMKVATETKNPVKEQVTTALEVNSNHSIKEEQVMLQGMTSQKNETSCTKKKYPGNPKKVVGLKDSISHSTKEDSVTSQETVTQVNKTSPALKKYPGILLKRPDLGSSVSSEHKEDSKTSQGTAALGEDNTNTFQQMTTLATDASPSLEKDEGTGKSQVQKEEPNSFQASPLRKSKSYSLNKCPSKQLPPNQNIKQPQEVKPFEYMQPQGARVFESIQPQRVQAFESMQPQRLMAFDSMQPQGVMTFESTQPQGVMALKFKQPQGVKAFEFKQAQGAKSFETKQQEKPLSYTPANWVCSLCKAVNHSWCKGCFKCAKVCAQLERKDFHPKPPY